MAFIDEDGKLIFERLKELMGKNAPKMVVSKNKGNVYELIGNKAVEYGSKKEIVPGMYFCSEVLRNTMVTFYFFPLYYNEELYEPIIPNLKKYLKGKTCFHFKKPDQIIEKEFKAMLKKGEIEWKKKGYLV